MSWVSCLAHVLEYNATLLSYLIPVAVVYWIYVKYVRIPTIASPSKPPRSAQKAPFKEGTTSGRLIPLINPVTGDKSGEEVALTPEQVDEALDRARVAQKEWAQTSYAERRGVLADLLEAIVQNGPAIAKASVLDTGKTQTEAMLGEILMPCEKIRWLIRYGEEYLKPESRPAPLILSFVKKAQVDYWPLGTIGIIVPWNYPFQNVLSAVVAAIFAGNAAVTKVSEFSTGSRAFYEQIFRDVLAKRGHNPDLIQLIAGYGDTGAALVTSKKIDHLFFIGSPATGKRIMEGCVPNLTPCTLELGGKDPFIIFDDAEFEHVLDVAVRAVYLNNGQNCISAERLFVQEGVFDRFVSEITKRVSAIRLSKDCGSITMPAQVKIVESLIEDAVKKGAKVVLGGKRAPSCGPLFFEPTILTNVTTDMKIVVEETFGPVMLIFKFRTEEQVVEMANNSEFGLSASVFTTDYAKANRLADKIVSGMLCINDWAIPPLIQSLPFGGVKTSGFGRFNGPEGLRAFTRQRALVTDRFPSRAQTPAFLKYPIPEKTPALLNNAIAMIYSRRPGDRFSALFQFLRGLISK